MKKIKVFLLLGILGILGVNMANAQIGIAVAKDDNGSSVEWQIVWNAGYQTESKARQKLEAKGHTKVYTLTGGKEHGHNLTRGYWVVVEAKHKIYDGTMITSYGLGASSRSYSEAEQRAVSNISTYDWSWKKSNGYRISKKGTFSP